MNRNIKFRAWHATAKKMFTAEEMAEDQLTLLPTGKFINVSGTSTNLSTIYESMVPLQYTGLKDCNGKEIYEGDVVQDIVMGSNCQIVYTEYANFGLSPLNFKMDDLKYEIIDPAYSETTLEVIGNVFQNPELLKKEVAP